MSSCIIDIPKCDLLNVSVSLNATCKSTVGDLRDSRGWWVKGLFSQHNPLLHFLSQNICRNTNHTLPELKPAPCFLSAIIGQID